MRVGRSPRSHPLGVAEVRRVNEARPGLAAGDGIARCNCVDKTNQRKLQQG